MIMHVLQSRETSDDVKFDSCLFNKKFIAERNIRQGEYFNKKLI